MFLRLSWIGFVAFVLVSCRPSVKLGVGHSGLQTCNGPADCPPPPGSLVQPACTNGVCQPVASGSCNAAGPDGGLDTSECDDGNPCTLDSCEGGSCTYAFAAGPGCCDTTCSNPVDSFCQSGVFCLQHSCSFEVITPLKVTDGPDKTCCNVNSDCSSVAAGTSCSTATNHCTCSGGKHYCGVTTDNTAAEICVSGTQCCDAAACGPAAGGAQCSDGACTCGNGLTACGKPPSMTCQQCCGSDTSTCTGTLGSCQQWSCNSGVCTKVPKITPGQGCCNGNGDCSGGTCNASNQCVCNGANDTQCDGAVQGATCCPAVANGNIGCSPPCTLTCTAGYHSCNGANSCIQASDTSCGSLCLDCTSGLTTCQSGACTSMSQSGTCTLSARNILGCCANNSLLGNCPIPSTCQTASCDLATNRCQVSVKTGPTCCSNVSPCAGSAACGMDNICNCNSTPTTPKYCPGFGCIASAACCVDADCNGVISNGTATCNQSSHSCVVSSCNAGYHQCTATNSCQLNTSITACGSMCLPCAGPTNGCQTTVCASGTCGYVKSGPTSGGVECCNPATANSDCVGNSCQAVAACTSNECVFTGKTNVAGCCNLSTVDSNCPAPSDPCLKRTCIANQCGTSVIAGCVPDMSGLDMALPRDMAPPSDLAPGSDLNATPDLLPPAPDLARARDLAAPGQMVSVTGGGGCALAGPAAPAGSGALVMLLGFTLSLALRRRRH
jgi:hypothetical protein